jgi:CRISPR system Cascade subunit CasB
MSDVTARKETLGSIARDWWRELRQDTAAAAKLRRCATVAEAMQEPPALLLFRRLGGRHAQDLPRIALAAAVLAHVRADAWAEAAGPTTARLIGPESLEKPETALVKPLRFRRLMEASDGDERLTAFRRLVAIADGSLPVPDLAEAMLRWTDHRRRDWVLQYWNAAPTPTQQAAEDAAR